MAEIWKEIPGFEGLYEASNRGLVRSLRYKSVRVLKPHFRKKTRYPHVGLYDRAGKLHCWFVHKAVYVAFCGPLPAGMEIDHIDNDPANASLENLQILSRRENMLKSWEFRRANGYRASNGSTKRGVA